MSDNTLNEIIRDHAMLVSVHIKHWSASVTDNAAARAAADASGAQGAGAYKAHKNLMFRNDSRLKAVQKAGNELRALHNARTMAWDTGKSNFRMLPTVQFQAYTQAIAKAKSHYDKKLQEFLDNYLNDAAAARRSLNIDNDPNAHRLYPTEDAVKHRFGVELAFEPIPAGRAFRNIPDTAVEALSNAHETRVKSRYNDALAEARADIAASLAHLRGLLRAEVEDGKAQRWKDSSVDNIVMQSKMLKHFDLEGNEQHVDWCGRVHSYFSRLNKKMLTHLRLPSSTDERIDMCDDIAKFEIELENLIDGNSE